MKLFSYCHDKDRKYENGNIYALMDCNRFFLNYSTIYKIIDRRISYVCKCL